MLSGYVLSIKRRKADSLSVITDAMIKRWFRLVPLVLFSTIFSAVLFKLHLYRFDDAQDINKFERLYDNWNKVSQNIQPTLNTIIKEGLLTFFIGGVEGSHTLNPPSWTMKGEFYGSMLVLSLSLAFINGHVRKFLLLSILLILIGAMFYEDIFSIICTSNA